MDIYKRLLRPLLFKLDAETAHNLARELLRRPALSRIFTGSNSLVDDKRLHVQINGLTLPNPVGLSAGFDKDCDMAGSLMRFGFGFVVVGSIMVNVRPGNPRPRMVRDLERQSLYSCMGLPSLGLRYSLESLKRYHHRPVPLIANFNAETYDEYVAAFHALQPVADALELSLFCPNRPADAGDFLHPDTVGKLLDDILKSKRKPFFIKLPGYTTETDRQRRLELVDRLKDYPVDGITITPESRVKEPRLSIGQGTLTGPRYREQVMGIVSDFYEIVGKRVAIMASGGMVTARDAFEAIAAGASSVEVYTGLIYEGWNMARRINTGLLDLMQQRGVQDLTTLRGSKIRLE